MSSVRCSTAIRIGIAISVAFAITWPMVAVAEEVSEPDATDWKSALDNEFYKLHVNARVRVELVDFDGLDASQAYTVRTRLGVETKPFYGLSFYVEGENVFSFAESRYFDTVETPTGQSPIADPEKTEVNQLFAQYQKENLLDLDLKGGRQRIKLDDERFVGNVGWRQNEQTYDAARIAVSPGVDGLTTAYGYIWDVRRIFGNQGPPSQRDFDSRSHFVRIAYDKIEGAKIVVFAYLFDFDNSPRNSSNSYGFRVTGQLSLSEPLSLKYAASYAVQRDAASNPVNYTAHYVAVEAALDLSDVGAMAGGYELLGSDDGRARFVTPLATAHKFNGWADAFLDNGGTNGLQDLYFSASPKLPWGIEGKLIYHRFWSDEGRDSLGGEIDIVVSKQINRYVQILSKGAWFNGSSEGPVDRWRYSLEANLVY